MNYHIKARGTFYPFTKDKVKRFPVPDDKIPWSVPWPEYNPQTFTSPRINKQPWADRDINDRHFKPKWNDFDEKVNRKSHHGNYEIVNNCPRNPIGRTGLAGRGCLGRWGPNHAADPIVTRWKREDGEIEIHPESEKEILQFVAIQRKDTLEWAIPGGMVDPGEKVSLTLKREFGEEALNSMVLIGHDRMLMLKLVEEFFEGGEEIYKGYVDDPRNTDNAWMETVAVNFHDETGKSVGRFPLYAGDDAIGVKWTDIDAKLSLYASHIDFIEQVAELHDAHW
uniref:ADP-ribose pyrophosphatase, mitochondrial n=1 Tax=Hemiscolopendra marginata TaxID=943146 RepID=A0A646QDT9_9MYRI